MASLLFVKMLMLGLILSLTGAAAFTLRCPNGFVGYQGACYKFSTMPATWIEAKVLCEMMDAHLLEVQSPLEEQFIMTRVFLYQPELKEMALWMGATDLMNKDEWVWMHSKMRVGYRNWSMNRPEVMSPDHGNCLAIQSQPYIAWKTMGCKERQFFICEREMN